MGAFRNSNTGTANNASGSTVTGTLPTGFAGGDLLIFALSSATAGTPPITWSTPSGWTALTRKVNGHTTGQIDVFWKIAAGGDTDPATTETGFSADCAWLTLAYSAINQLSQIPTTASDADSLGSSAWVAPTITTGFTNSILLTLVAACEPASSAFPAWSAPTGETQRASQYKAANFFTDVIVSAFDVTVGSPGATGTKTPATAPTNSRWSTYSIEIRDSMQSGMQMLL